MGGRPTTLWVYLVPFGRYTWERACIALAERYVTHARTHAAKKTSEKSNFLVEGLAHGREIFRVDAAFVAAHFPPGLFGVRIQRTELFRQNGAETTPTSQNKWIYVLAHIISSSEKNYS